MNPFTQEEIDRARIAVGEISERLAAITSTDHPLEREQQIDLLRVYISPAPGHSLVNLCEEITRARIDATLVEFIEATRQFYTDEEVARKAAENTSAVAALQHTQRELGSSPSVESAERLLGVLTEFLSSPAAALAEA